MGFLFEAFLEHAEGGWERASDGDHNGVFLFLMSPGELNVEGIGKGLGVRLVDLELNGKLGERAKTRQRRNGKTYCESETLVAVVARVDFGHDDVVFEIGFVGVDVVVLCEKCELAIRLP
jgi:hypothetical protein